MPRPPEPSWWNAWANWLRSGHVRSRRPKDAPKRIPQWAWDLYSERYPHHKPTPPDPPKPKPSWTDDKPVVFTAWAPDEVAPDPRWHKAIIDVPGVAPLWRVDGKGWIAQAESEPQIDVALGLLDGKQGEKAIVATQGGWVHPHGDGTYDSLVHRFLEAGVNVVLGEAYVNDGGPSPERIVWQAKHDGWTFAFPVVGCYHGYPLSDYQLGPYGRGFGVWTGETMQEADWITLASYSAV